MELNISNQEKENYEEGFFLNKLDGTLVDSLKLDYVNSSDLLLFVFVRRRVPCAVREHFTFLTSF